MIPGSIIPNQKRNMARKIHAEKSMKEPLVMFHRLKKKNIGKDMSIYGLIMPCMKNAFVIILK